MDMKKWIPWNWFKKEDEAAGGSVPVRRDAGLESGYGAAGSLARFHQDVDRIFGQAFRGFGLTPWQIGRASWPFSEDDLLKPTLDLAATDKAYAVDVEIPGVKASDIDVEIVNDTLTIRGEKRRESKHSEKNFYRMERTYGSFQRVLSLPEDVDQDGVTATMKKGVLTITMPRTPVPRADVKKIGVSLA